jgi:ATP-dependent Clp protease protease subunit
MSLRRKEKMKTLALILFVVVFGCATNPVAIAPQQHEFTLNIKGVDTVRVEEAGSGVSRSMEIKNPEGKLSHLAFIINDRAFIKIFSGLSVGDVTNLWNDLVYLEYNTTIRDVNLFINSPGGDAFSGLALSDQIERAKGKGFKITAHASGIIASAAVPVFAVCNVRLAAPGTIFMVHEAALWKWPGRETASQIRSQNDLMELLRDRYLGKLVDNTTLSRSEWEAMERKTTWFSADRALEIGLVDKIE